MSDDRIGRLARTYVTYGAPSAQHLTMAMRAIGQMEVAGLLVVDPADPAVIDRVARALHYQYHLQDERWDRLQPSQAAQYQADARAVLTALGGAQ